MASQFTERHHGKGTISYTNDTTGVTQLKLSSTPLYPLQLSSLFHFAGPDNTVFSFTKTYDIQMGSIYWNCN
jgi:hypothetical protein